MGSLIHLLRKEFIQFRRNKFLPRLIFLLPIVVMLVAPLVADMSVRDVRLAYVDRDGSDFSRGMLSHLDAADGFRFRQVTTDGSAAFEQLEQGRIDVIVTVPEGFEREMTMGGKPQIKVDANAVNATKGTLGAQYVVRMILSALSDFYEGLGVQTVSAGADTVNVRYLYNETLDYRFYMIPTFLVILVLLVCCFIPALNLVVEKEKGTIEQINVTPVSRLAFSLSKLIPYWLIGLVVFSEGTLTVGLVYGLWPRGSIGGIYLVTLLFSFAMSGFAVTIANGSDNMQQSVFVLFFFVMLFMNMSDLLTPLNSMPAWAQTITLAFPTRYFVAILRALYLKGTLVAELWKDYLGLAVLSLIFGLLAALSYRKRS